MTRIWLAALMVAAAVGAQRSSGVATPTDFQELVRAADGARQGNRLDEAADLYRKATALKADWAEGWWYLGTILYDQDKYSDAAAALSRFSALRPDVSAGWALLGLCEYQTRLFGPAATHLERGFEMGLSGSAELEGTVRFHRALLMIIGGRFEEAREALRPIVRVRPNSPPLVSACGLFTLHMSAMLEDIPPAKRGLVDAAGRAGCEALRENVAEEMRPLFDDLVRLYPNEPWVHYAYGSFIMNQSPDEGLAALREELKVFPGNVRAKQQIAFERLRRGEIDEAVRMAKEAIGDDPGQFVGHFILGQAYLQKGMAEEAVRALEEAVRLAPQNPQARLNLSRAYRRAGRVEDAEREGDIFEGLEAIQDVKESAGGQAEGAGPQR